MTIIPVRPSEPFYDFTTDIEGEVFRFVVRWNARERDGVGAWYLDIFDASGGTVALGVKVVTGVQLARRVHHLLTRSGVLIAVDTSGARRDPGLDDFGTRVELRYYTKPEMAQLILDAERAGA